MKFPVEQTDCGSDGDTETIGAGLIVIGNNTVLPSHPS